MAKSVISKVTSLEEIIEGTWVVFVEQGGAIKPEIAARIDAALVTKLTSLYDFDGEKFKSCTVMLPQKTDFNRLILIGVGEMTKLDRDDWLKLGGVTAAALGEGNKVATQTSIALSFATLDPSQQQITDFITGLALRRYKFDKYQTKKQDKKHPSHITLQVAQPEVAKQAQQDAQAITLSVKLARDLVNEPANILGTVEFTDKIEKLTRYGLKIDILKEKELEKLGMGALLGVAQGSPRPPRLVVMKWEGGKAKEPPVAFVGKGVVFDTGGISIKPAGGMEDMKGDMGGAAAVVGAMMALALSKLPVNAVGVVGLVENMPDGNAQRPGDIVTSMSGQTIEIINTDAEGRLVLADALWYTKETFNPKFMVNFATLTGAILVALGKHYAGLFSNDDTLCAQLSAAGEKTGERVWRLPLGEEYDKIVDSKVADMRNATGRDAGSICAAQFLKRFVGDTPWAHLDIAGTAMDCLKNEYNQSWASGYGVRLVHQLAVDIVNAR